MSPAGLTLAVEALAQSLELLRSATGAAACSAPYLTVVRDVLRRTHLEGQ